MTETREKFLGYMQAEPEKKPTSVYSLEFSSDMDLAKVDDIEELIVKLAEPYGWPEDTIYDVQLGFREIFINAIVYGNLNLQKTEENAKCFDKLIKKKQNKDVSGKKVRVKIEINDNKLMIVIQDQGNKEINRENISTASKEKNVSKTSGRGIEIAELYFDEFDMHPIKNGDRVLGTEVVMSKYKNKTE